MNINLFFIYINVGKHTNQWDPELFQVVTELAQPCVRTWLLVNRYKRAPTTEDWGGDPHTWKAGAPLVSEPCALISLSAPDPAGESSAPQIHPKPMSRGALRRKLQPAAQEEALDLRCWCIRRCEAIGEGHGQTLLMCETLKAYFHIFGGFTHMLGKADFCTQVKSDYGGFLRCLRDVLALRWVLFWMALRGGRRGNRRKVKP